MSDILAVLDAAAAELDASDTSRNSRGEPSNGNSTGTTKSLEGCGLPALPVVPVHKQGIFGDHTHIDPFVAHTGPKIEGGSREESLSSTGITGTTGSREGLCEQTHSRYNIQELMLRELARISAENSREVLFCFLSNMHLPPGDVPPKRWHQFLIDVEIFVAAGWLDKARALGWRDSDLYGCDAERPYARIDLAGLLWLLNGGRVIALTAELARIERGTTHMTFYRNDDEAVR